MQPTISPRKGQIVFSGQKASPNIFGTSISKSFYAFFLWKNLVFPMLLLVLFSACWNPEDSLPLDNVSTEMKHTIAFKVAQAKDYTDQIYDGSKATLNLTISVENMRDGSNIILWDTVFHLRELREFPAPDAPLLIQKNISRVSDANEVLRLSNSIRYFDKYSHTWVAAIGETVPRDRSLFAVEISL